ERPSIAPDALSSRASLYWPSSTWILATGIGSLAEVADRIERLADALQRRPHMSEHAFAGLGWCHAARRAVEQAYAELLFQKLDALAQRRSLDAQLFRRPGEIALLRHRDEGRDLVEVICAHRPKLAMNSGDCSHKLQCSEPGAAAAAGLF